MGAHLIDGEFQSDKYPTCPRGKVPLSVRDPAAQDLLWEYAQRRRKVDSEFSDDLEAALIDADFDPEFARRKDNEREEMVRLRVENAALRELRAAVVAEREAAIVYGMAKSNYESSRGLEDVMGADKHRRIIDTLNSSRASYELADDRFNAALAATVQL